MNGILRTYKRILMKHPTKVQALQTGILMGAGDAIAQTLVEKKKLQDYDAVRTARFFGIGFCIAGPGLKVWYGFLDKYVAKRRTDPMAVIKKVIVDQCIFAPNFLASYVVLLGALEMKPLSSIKEKLERDYFDILMTNYKVWPAVQLLNFYLTPLQYQVLFVQVVALFWNTYLSWKTSVPVTEKIRPVNSS